MLIQEQAAHKRFLQVTKTPDLTTIQGRLRVARELAGLGTKGLSEKLKELGVDVSDAHVSRVENGQAGLELDYLAAAARVGNVSLDWIVYGEGDLGTAKDVIWRMRRELDRAEKDYVRVATSPSVVRPPGGAPRRRKPPPDDKANTG